MMPLTGQGIAGPVPEPPPVSCGYVNIRKNPVLLKVFICQIKKLLTGKLLFLIFVP
jgi:hypothetical protein